MDVLHGTIDGDSFANTQPRPPRRRLRLHGRRTPVQANSDAGTVAWMTQTPAKADSSASKLRRRHGGVGDRALEKANSGSGTAAWRAKFARNLLK